MNPNDAIVIHPNDDSTRFLKRLYSGYGEQTLLTEENNNKVIKEALMNESDRRILMMLGHGCPQGLFAPRKDKNYQNGIDQFGRLIINASHVQILRKKLCIGIWCYAVDFARKYNLHGLFSGMIISEVEEAQDCGMYEFTKEEMQMYNQDFAEALYDCINKYPLNEVPQAMENYVSNPNRLELFNYSNLYYL
jgi:hypothetical protein